MTFLYYSNRLPSIVVSCPCKNYFLSSESTCLNLGIYYPIFTKKVFFFNKLKSVAFSVSRIVTLKPVKFKTSRIGTHLPAIIRHFVMNTFCTES